jgi:hypothetical protein
MKKIKYLIVIGFIMSICACQGTGRLTLSDEGGPAAITAKFVTADGTEFKGGNLGVYTELFLSFSSDPLASINVSKAEVNLNNIVSIYCADEVKSIDENVPLEKVNDTLYKLNFADNEVYQKMDCDLSASWPEFNVALKEKVSFGCGAGGPANLKSLQECFDYNLGVFVVNFETFETMFKFIPVDYNTFKLLFNTFEVRLNAENEYVLAMGDVNYDFADIFISLGGLNKGIGGGLFAILSKSYLAGGQPDVEINFDYRQSELSYLSDPRAFGVSILNNAILNQATRQMSLSMMAEEPANGQMFFKSVFGETGDVICDAAADSIGSGEFEESATGGGPDPDKCVAKYSSHKMRVKFKDYGNNQYMIGGWSQDSPWLWGEDLTGMIKIDGFDNSNGTTAALYYIMMGAAGGAVNVDFQVNVQKGFVSPEPPPGGEGEVEPFVAEISWNNLGDLPANAQ